MLALALLATAPLRFHYDANEFTNVVYHVACVAGRLPCTKPVFERFWHDRLQWSPADQAQLDAWLRIVDKLQGAAPKPAPAPFIPNFAGWFPSRIPLNRIIITAAEAGSSGAFRKQAVRLMTREDAGRMTAALEHFQRRFDPWWVATGKQIAEALVRKLKRQKNDLAPFASQVAAFMEAKLEKEEVFMHAVAGPEPKSKDATASPVWTHFFIEVTDDATPDWITSIAIHELTHTFYDRAPAEKHLGLMKEFVDSKEPHAQGFYTFLNEGLATAVQGLLGEQRGEKDDDPYHHPYIPRLGRAAMPLLKEALAKRSTLFSGFAEQYLRAGAEELKQDVTNPKFILSSVALFSTEKTDKAKAVYLEALPPWASAGPEDWKQFSELNAVFFHTYDELEHYVRQIPELGPLQRHRGFAYSTPHGKKGRALFLAGRDAEALIDVVKRLAAVPSLPAEGLIFSIE
jgi:hypothetical protein